MHKVLIPQDINEEGKNFLRQQGYEVIIGSRSDAETIKKEIVDCDALIARTALYTSDVIKAGKKLKIIARYGVGTDNIDVKAATEQGVYVTIAKNANVKSVAEHTISLMLSCAKKIVYYDKETRKGNWETRVNIPSTELFGKTLGIIGLGSIGLEVAKKAYFGLDMNIVGFVRNKNKKTNIPGYISLLDSADDVFRKSDVVTIHIPRTNETINMVNKKIFDIMKPTAYLINTARGGIVNEEDLYDALNEKRIASAGLDVFDEEPAGADNKLFTLDNLIVSPHNAALTLEANNNMSLSAAKAVHDVLNGKVPEYPINNPMK